MIRIDATNRVGFRSRSISVEWLVLSYFLISLVTSIILRSNTAAVDGFFRRTRECLGGIGLWERICRCFWRFNRTYRLVSSTQCC